MSTLGAAAVMVVVASPAVEGVLLLLLRVMRLEWRGLVVGVLLLLSLLPLPLPLVLWLCLAGMALLGFAAGRSFSIVKGTRPLGSERTS
jgi:hypothetical protein